MGKKILPEERRLRIYNIVQRRGTATLGEMCAELGVSESTVRLDLNKMEQQGLIKRTHGGAVLSESAAVNHERQWMMESLSVNRRIQQNAVEKDAIGRAAAAMIKDGESLMIDGGSTTPYVANHLLDKRGLTIITNSVFLITTLMANPDATLYLSGGIIYREIAVSVGETTNAYLGQFSVDKTILGINGFSVKHGLTVADAREPAVLSAKNKMIEACSELIIVCDHTKIGMVCLASLGFPQVKTCLVTGYEADAQSIAQFREMGIQVELVEYETEQ